MNLALRKLAMLEKAYAEMDEVAKIQGYSTVPYDQDFKRKVVNLMDKVRVI